MIKSLRLPYVLFLAAAAVLAFAPHRVAAQDERGGAVFAMTNAASNNQINAYVRRDDGSLEFSGAFPTGGNGSGGTLDPLHSQGSLTLTPDHSLLFAVNAGSGTLSSFAVRGAQLALVDTVSTSGSLPTSVTQASDLVYILNAGGNGSVTGFHILPNGHLLPIPNSTRYLSGSATAPTDVVLSPNGQFLVVIESATNKIDVFRVFPNGTLSNPVVNDSAGTVPFAAAFAPSGALIVGNVENNQTVSSTISSYQLDWNGSLHTISNALPTGGSATCWDVIGRLGRSVYTSNPNNSTLSGFNIERNGELTPIGDAVVGQTPADTTNIDVAASSDGRYLYTLYAATGAIGIFAVQEDGSLVSVGQQDGLPASAGINGIAAY
ncbi:MAG: beta-propeller fold lactonase family protein [Acidobacteriaceae bacterium]